MAMNFTNKITVRDVRVIFTRYAELVEIIDHTKVKLDEGSQSNGRAYRVTVDGMEAPGTGDRGYIGWTAREAYDTLHIIIRTLEYAKRMGL